MAKLGIFFRRFAPFLFLAALLTGLAAYGIMRMDTRFSRWDDEGTVLYALVTFLRGHPLYSELGTQYGPAYFFLHQALLDIFQWPATHDNIRILSWLFWLCGSAALSAAVWRHTRDTILSAIAMMATFWMASTITYEPSHPQAILYPLVAFSVLIWTWMPSPIAVVWLGIIAGAAFCTKTNIGVFLFAGSSMALLNPTDRNPFVRGIRWLVVAGIVLLPYALMHAYLREAPALVYCVIAITGSISVWLWSRHGNEPGLNSSVFLPYLGGFIVAVAIFCALACANGTPVSKIYYGIIGQHVGFSDTFRLRAPFAVRRLYLVWPLLSFLCCITSVALVRRGEKSWFRTVLATAKIAFVGIVLWQAMQPEFSMSIAGHLVSWAWLAMVPSSSPAYRPHARFPLIALAALQFLTAHPVAGSQQVWSLILLVPISCLLLADVVATLPSFGRMAPAAVFVAMLMIVSGSTISLYKSYRTGVTPVVLLGSARLRLPEAITADYEGITLNIRSHADRLLSIPGLYSFYLWSGRDSPTLMNQGNWPLAFNESKQTKIVELTSPFRRLMVVSNMPIMYHTWQGEGEKPNPNGPLVRFIEQEFTSVCSIGGYDLLARNSDSGAWTPIGARWTSQDCITIQLPVTEASLHQLEIVNPDSGNAMPLANLPNSSDFIRFDADDESTGFTIEKLSTEGVSLRKPQTVSVRVGHATHSPRPIARCFDGSGRLLFRLPFFDEAK